MKKSLILSAMMASAMSASAIVYSDTDNFTSVASPLGVLLTVGGTPITGTFDLSNSDGDAGDITGYDPDTQSIIEAIVGFTFRDLNGTANHVAIDMNGQDFILNGAVSKSLTSLGGLVIGNAYLTLDEFGAISYSLELLDGDDIYLSMAALDADAGDRVISVPETGMTLSLLGMGFLASAWISRKFRVSKQI